MTDESLDQDPSTTVVSPLSYSTLGLPCVAEQCPGHRSPRGSLHFLQSGVVEDPRLLIRQKSTRRFRGASGVKDAEGRIWGMLRWIQASGRHESALSLILVYCRQKLLWRCIWGNNAIELDALAGSLINNMRLGRQKDTPLPSLFLFPSPSPCSYSTCFNECLSSFHITASCSSCKPFTPRHVFIFLDHVIGLHLRPLYSKIDPPAA